MFGFVDQAVKVHVFTLNITGVMNDDYKSLLNVDTPGEGLNAYSATGFSTTIIASRVSYVYNLRGPCMAIDTACSSALIAVHLGSQAIKAGTSRG